MMSYYELFKFDLRTGEVVVAAVPFRDDIIVVTNNGTVYKITKDQP